MSSKQDKEGHERRVRASAAIQEAVRGMSNVEKMYLVASFLAMEMILHCETEEQLARMIAGTPDMLTGLVDGIYKETGAVMDERRVRH